MIKKQFGINKLGINFYDNVKGIKIFVPNDILKSILIKNKIKGLKNVSNNKTRQCCRL